MKWTGFWRGWRTRPKQLPADLISECQASAAPDPWIAAMQEVQRQHMSRIHGGGGPSWTTEATLIRNADGTVAVELRPLHERISMEGVWG